MKAYITKLLALFDRPGKIRLGGLFILICTVTLFEMLGLGLVFPLIEGLKAPETLTQLPVLSFFYKNYFVKKPEYFLPALGIVIAIAYIVKNLTMFMLIYLQNRFIQNRIALMSHAIFVGHLKLPYTLHIQKNTSELLRNLESSVSLVLNKGLLSILSLLMDSMLTIGLLSVLFIVDFWSTLLVTLMVTLGFSVFYLVIQKRMQGWGRTEHSLVAQVYKWVNQSMGAFQEIRILGKEDYFGDQFRQTAFARSSCLIKLITAEQSPRILFEIFAVLGMFIIASTIALQGKPLDSALTTLAMFAIASFRLLPSANRMAACIALARKVVVHLEVLHSDYEVFAQSANEKKKCMLSEKITPLRKSIGFENVSFRYPGTEEPSVLNINLKIKKGETLGIVGPTGAGKTTLVGVLLGLLVSPEGRVLVDGRDIHENLTSWQDQLGYVPQKIYLLDDSLRRNIAFGQNDTEIDEAKIKNILKLTHLDTFVASLPRGLDTMIGECGVRLSGGQGQRIGIARALYHDPEVLILDEATSSLDNETERKISLEIEEASHSKTSIIIAHRLGTILKCDRIAYMKDGTIIDIGGAEELASRNTEFRRQIELGNFTKTA